MAKKKTDDPSIITLTLTGALVVLAVGACAFTFLAQAALKPPQVAVVYFVLALFGATLSLGAMTSAGLFEFKNVVIGVSVRLAGSAGIGAAFFFLLMFLGGRLQSGPNSVVVRFEDESGTPVEEEFEIVAYPQEQGYTPVLSSGENSVTMLLPHDVERYKFSLKCRGWVLHKPNEEVVADSRSIRLVVRKDEEQEPTLPRFPYVGDRLPTAAEMLAPPSVDPAEVRGAVINSTAYDLVVYIYNCYSKSWAVAHLAKGHEPFLIDKFTTPSGWVVVFASKGSVADAIFVGRYDFYKSKYPCLFLESRSRSEMQGRLQDNDDPPDLKAPK